MWDIVAAIFVRFGIAIVALLGALFGLGYLLGRM